MSLRLALPLRVLSVVLCVGALLSHSVPADAAQRGTAQRGAGGRDRLQLHQEKHKELREQFAATVLKTADFCDEHGFRDDAERIRRLADPEQVEELRGEPLPETVQPEPRLDLPPEERKWRTELHHAQADHAKDLYLLAQRLVNHGYASYAFDVVREAAIHDPDNKAVRKVLGFVQYQDRWVTPYTADMLKRKHVWHETFGWLPAAHVKHYENGERYFNGQFITAAKDAVLRKDFANAWEVRTDHFLVKTNHSLERGVEVASALEDFHDWFTMTFAAFFQTPEQLRRLFREAATRSAPIEKPHEVHYYATREEYVARLKPKIPQIDITNGLYFTNDRTAYFFHDPAGANDSTLFHEATHQLLYESSKADRPIAQKEQFWVIEGIACYMESFRRDRGRISVGDPRYQRFAAARYRFLNDNYYVPLAKLDAMGMNDFQSDPNISRNYSQASGLVHFFMHYDGGKYRDAMIEHLSQHYSVSRRVLPQVQSLADLTGVEDEELDRQYGEFVKAVHESLQRQRTQATIPSE